MQNKNRTLLLKSTSHRWSDLSTISFHKTTDDDDDYDDDYRLCLFNELLHPKAVGGIIMSIIKCLSLRKYSVKTWLQISQEEEQRFKSSITFISHLISMRKKKLSVQGSIMMLNICQKLHVFSFKSPLHPRNSQVSHSQTSQLSTWFSMNMI